MIGILFKLVAQYFDINFISLLAKILLLDFCLYDFTGIIL